MKKFLFILPVLLSACDDEHANRRAMIQTADSTRQRPEIPLVNPFTPDTTKVDSSLIKQSISDTFGNKIFKNVVVLKTGEDLFEVLGEAQVTNASFNWVIEDGHNELKQGTEKTDSLTTQFSSFNFKFVASKHKPQDTATTLHLILYEKGKRNGKRQNELFIPLP